MNWRVGVIVAVALTVGPGCLEEWRKGGAIDRAIAKDTRENMPKPAWVCPSGQAFEWECPQESTDPEECRWTCR
jgi:hypothetical protein